MAAKRLPAPQFSSQPSLTPVRSYGGKRAARIRIPNQVNQDPDMSTEIMARAERQMRTIGSEIVHLLSVGISNDPEQPIFEYFLGAQSSKAHTKPRRAKTVQAMLDRMVREMVDSVLKEKGLPRAKKKKSKARKGRLRSAPALLGNSE